MKINWQYLNIIFTACRGYSIPISVVSWFVPAIFAALNHGNIIYSFIALLGIIILHLATNIFDDAIDFSKEKSEIEKGLKKDFNFQKGKCFCILNGLITLKQAYIIAFSMFIAAFAIGLFFVFVWGLKLLCIIVPGAVICILYPILGSLGFGEILVSIVFAPLIYSGVYFVMTGNFSSDILLLSISTGLLCTAVLHNHMLLDYKFDTTNRKITLCRLCGNEKNALILLIIIITLAYLNLVICVAIGKLSYFYLLPVLTIPNAIILMKVMSIHIINPDKEIKYNLLMGNMNSLKNAPGEQKNFLLKFLLARNLLISFTIVLCISIVISYIYN